MDDNTTQNTTSQVPGPAPGSGSSRLDRWEPVLRQLSATGAAAVLAGAVIGGLGGRLAMHVLAELNPDVAGRRTDDGFIVGQVTFGGTVALLGSAVQLALFGAAVYLAIRPLLLGPGWARVATAAVGGGTTVGALLVTPNSFDFGELGHTLLAVVMFVTIPVAFLLAFGLLVERWLADGSWFMRAPRRRVLPLLVLWLLSALALPLVAVVLLVPAALRRLAGRLRPVGRAAGVWTLRVGMVGIFVSAVANLASDLEATGAV